MPRDRATLRTDLWADLDWRNLSIGAQWLYEYLLTTPSLSYVGVADWRPNRISKLARELTTDQVREYAEQLAEARFVVVDDETEEICVRSFLRHDGALKNPNLWKSIGKAFADTSSPTILKAIAREVVRLRDEFPEGMGKTNPWLSGDLQTILKTSTYTPIDTPSPKGEGQGVGTTTTSTTTSTNTSYSVEGEEKVIDEKKNSVPLPAHWAPTAEHIKRAKDMRIDVIEAADNFRLHAETHDRRAANWNAAFTSWLKKAPAQKPQHRHDPDWANKLQRGKPIIFNDMDD